MSYITVDQVKLDLRVTHNSDDALLQIHLDGAEDYVKRFLNRDELPTLPVDYPYFDSDYPQESEDVPSSDDPIAASVYLAVFLLVKAAYEAESADEYAKTKTVAESILMPYRTEWGV
jgi:hypothetical protein